MKEKTFFKLRGIVGLVAALLILLGSLFIPTVKLTVNDSNGLKDNGAFLSAITRLGDIAKLRGATDDEIVNKYGKYLKIAEEEYNSLGKNTSDNLLSEIKVAYKEWSGNETVDFNTLDLSAFEDLDSATRASFYYYVILSGQQELENIANPDKLYYVKALEKTGVNIDDYKEKIENAITNCRKELNVLVDGFNAESGNANDFSYSFSAPAPVQLVANLSEIKALLDLFTKEEEIYNKTVTRENAENSLSDKQQLKLYYETEYANAENELKELLSTLGYNVSNIENEFNTANSQISDAQNLINEANEKIKQATAEISEINKQISDKKALISAKRNQIADTLHEIDELQAQITKKQAPIVALQRDIDEINEKIDDYNNAIDDLKTLLTTLGYDVEHDTYKDEIIINIIQNDIANKQTLITTAQAKLTEKEQTRDEKQAEIQSEIDELQAQIAAKQSQISSENTDIEQENAQIDDLNAQIQVKQEFIKEQRAFVKEKESFISSASSFHNFLVSKAQDLINSKKQEISDIQAPIEDIRQEIKEIQATVKEYKNSVDNLKSLNTEFNLNVEGEIVYAQKIIDLLNDKIENYKTDISNKENESSEQITTKNNAINSLNTAINNFETLKLNNERTATDIETTEKNIVALNGEISAIENEIAENYEKYADSLNNDSFAFAMYYRQTAQMESDNFIDTYAEKYYELYFGIIHTYGTDVKTLNFLSLAALFIFSLISLYFLIETIVKAIKRVHNKEQLYTHGINAFVKAMTIFTGWSILALTLNSLTFGTGTFSVFGWLLVILCATVLAFNFIGGRSRIPTAEGKKAINVLHLSSIAEIVLLSFALGIFMLSGAMKPLASRYGDFIAYRKWVPSSFIWAAVSLLVVTIAYLHILMSLKTLGTVTHNIRAKLNYITTIIALSCVILMAAVMLIFAETFLPIMWALIVVIVLIALTLTTQIIQNKLLEKNTPQINVSDMKELVESAFSAPDKEHGEDKINCWIK